MTDLCQLTSPEPSSDPTLREMATAWIAENSQVMDLFDRFAAEMLARRRHFGLKALAERVRWECAYHWDESVKINNSFVAYIGRELVRRNPALAELIETRITKAANRPYRQPIKGQRVDPLTDEPMEDE